MKTIIILLFVATLSARANIVTNGDFESGSYGPLWVDKNTAAIRQVSTAENHTPGGSRALRIAGRSGSFANQAGVSATITAAITPNGRTWTTRAWVKLDAYASVRLLLQHSVNGVPQPPRVMADAVVLTPGAWVQITGTQTLLWNGSFSQAVLLFEIEQLQRTGTPAAQVRFPDYWVDDISIDLDDDGDGLLNSEESADHEQTTISFSDDADSDDDGIPDDFERAHPSALNPRNAADALVDFDHDEWSSIEEYIAATDPANAASRPGPSDPLATLPARALLRYLIRMAATGRHLCGQMVSDLAVDYPAYIDGLANLPGGGGRYPAVIGFGPETFNAPIDFAAKAAVAAQYAAAGGIITLQWQIYNPWVQSNGAFGNGNYLGAATDNYRIDLPGLVATDGVGATTNSPASNLAARAALLGWCDQVAALLKQHLPGVPILVRPFHEMNGGWYWWGHPTREEYRSLWNLVRDRFVTHHGMHNLLWVCSAAGDVHVPIGPAGGGTALDYYYPGDDVVDIVGAHFYDSFASPYDPDRVWARHPKVFAMPEFGSSKATRSTNAFDNRWVIDAIRTRMPRVAYFNAWASWTNHDDDDNNAATPANNDDGFPATNDTPTHKYIAIADNSFAAALLADPGVVTRDEVRFMPPTTLDAAAASSSSFALAWPGVAGNTGYAIESSASGAPGSWNPISTATVNATAASVGGFTPATASFFRVRTLFGADDTLPTDPASATTWSLFQQWKNDTLGNFNAPDLADDDRDGLASLMEYGLATNPLADSHAQQPTRGVANIGGADYLTLTFRRRIGLSGVNYVVEVTSDLVLGPWLAQPVLVGVPDDNGDGTESTTFRDIIPLGSAPSRFLRLRVTTP